MAADNENTCGLTQEKLDNHPNWVTERGICIALKPDGTQCGRHTRRIFRIIHQVYILIFLS